MRMVRGCIHTAAAGNVASDGVLVDVRQRANHLFRREGPLSAFAAQTSGGTENFVVDRHGGIIN